MIGWQEKDNQVNALCTQRALLSSVTRVELSRSRPPLLCIKAPQIFLNMGPDLLAFGALEISKDSFLPVEVEHRSRGGLEHLQSIPHRLCLVVLPLNKILTSLVVFPCNLGWVEDQVVDSAGRWVDPPVLDPVHDCLKRHVQIDDNVHRSLLLQGFCLCLGPGEPIQKPRLSVQLLELSSNKPDHH